MELRELCDSDTGQGNRHDVSWVKMQLSLYVIENEAARGRPWASLRARATGQNVTEAASKID